MSRLGRHIRRFLSDDGGGPTIEFMLIFPAVVFFVFLFGEIGTLSARTVLLKRGLDIAIRDVRLGNIPQNISPEDAHDLIKWSVCRNAFLLANCYRAHNRPNQIADGTLLLELIPVPLGAPLPNRPFECRNRNANIQPLINLNTGDRSNADGEIMLVRACIIAYPLFPATGYTAGLPSAQGGYAITAETVFLNEPL